jgi:hypothetical protein
MNGSGVTGFAAAKAELLETEGFMIGSLTNAPEDSWGPITIYKFNGDNPATEQKLADKYSVQVQPAPTNIKTFDQADFVIIFGQ